jgi:hypothetical protein
MDRFFDFAHERHSIYLRRAAGEARPWTEDSILDTYRFTNVYRELDATTVWFREKVRDPLAREPEVLLATVLFRWFNRTTTGEALFLQRTGDNGRVLTPFEHILSPSAKFDWSLVRQAIINYCGKGPYVTGAYIIKTPDGYDKIDGVLKCVEWFMKQKPSFSYTSSVDWRLLSERMLSSPLSDEHTLENTWNWLRQFSFLGDFMAYEIVTDLRHTDLLRSAPDIMTWANPGPGAMRGLNRLHERPLNHKMKKRLFVDEMRELLCLSQEGSWPNSDQYPALEMRDIEHTLCEFDKYERVRLGEGRPRGVYRAD